MRALMLLSAFAPLFIKHFEICDTPFAGTPNHPSTLFPQGLAINTNLWQ